jgi:hypothetical protein
MGLGRVSNCSNHLSSDMQRTTPHRRKVRNRFTAQALSPLVQSLCEIHSRQTPLPRLPSAPQRKLKMAAEQTTWMFGPDDLVCVSHLIFHCSQFTRFLFCHIAIPSTYTSFNEMKPSYRRLDVTFACVYHLAITSTIPQ